MQLQMVKHCHHSFSRQRL